MSRSSTESTEIVVSGVPLILYLMKAVLLVQTYCTQLPWKLESEGGVPCFLGLILRTRPSQSSDDHEACVWSPNTHTTHTCRHNQAHHTHTHTHTHTRICIHTQARYTQQTACKHTHPVVQRTECVFTPVWVSPSLQRCHFTVWRYGRNSSAKGHMARGVQARRPIKDKRFFTDNKESFFPFNRNIRLQHLCSGVNRSNPGRIVELEQFWFSKNQETFKRGSNELCRQ